MAKQLRIGIGRSDRSQAIIDGRIGMPGRDCVVETGSAETLFRRAFDSEAYDVAELSLANFAVTTAAGRCPYVALPVFTSRLFRHAAIYIRTDRGIAGPGDLNGRTIGIREFSNTATVTAKGMLQDEYGVRQDRSAWRYGPVNAGEEPPIPRIIPAGIAVEPLAAGHTLSAALAAGQIDAVIAYAPPDCFVQGHPQVARLFPDYPASEAAYFQRSGIFPIMHLLGIRKAIADDTALCMDVCRMFEMARREALAKLEDIQTLPIMLPWLSTAAAQARATLGADYWPYGLAKNIVPLTAALRWLNDQGLLATPLQLGALFASGVAGWSPDAEAAR